MLWYLWGCYKEEIDDVSGFYIDQHIVASQLCVPNINVFLCKHKLNIFTDQSCSKYWYIYILFQAIPYLCWLDLQHKSIVFNGILKFHTINILIKNFINPTWACLDNGMITQTWTTWNKIHGSEWTLFWTILKYLMWNSYPVNKYDSFCSLIYMY